MNLGLLISGFYQDLNKYGEEINRYHTEYTQLNSLLPTGRDKYEDVLLDYSTSQLKYALGFLTPMIDSIKEKGYKQVDAVFDTLEHRNELPLSIFYGNRILERFTGNSPEEILTRIYTLRRMLNNLLHLDDIPNFIKYLLLFIENLKEFYIRYPNMLKENGKNGLDFYHFLLPFYMKAKEDNEGALGVLIKGYNLKKAMIQEGLLPYPEENNIFQIINIVGLWTQVGDILSFTVDIEEYISEFVKQIQELVEESKRKPFILTLYLKQPFKKYINQFLLNLYVMGFEEEFNKVVETLPEILSLENRIIIDIYKLDTDTPEGREKLLQIKKQIEKAVNNISLSSRARVLFVFYDTLVSTFSDDIDTLLQLKEELEEHRKKLKNRYELDIPYIRILFMLNEEEEGERLLDEVIRKAIIDGNRSVLKTISNYFPHKGDLL